MNNIKFWVYSGSSYTKIKLQPGESVTHWRTSRDEEGGSTCIRTWEYDAKDQVLRLAMCDYARDCDGPWSYTADYEAHLTEIASQPSYCGEFLQPNWRRLGYA